MTVSVSKQTSVIVALYMCHFVLINGGRLSIVRNLEKLFSI